MRITLHLTENIVPGYSPGVLGFDSRRYQIFWELAGLERGPLSRVRINEIDRKSSDSGLENKLTAVENRRADHAKPLYPQKLALNFADQRRMLSRYSSLSD
jgi:hypothetical protein